MDATIKQACSHLAAIPSNSMIDSKDAALLLCSATEEAYIQAGSSTGDLNGFLVELHPDLTSKVGFTSYHNATAYNATTHSLLLQRLKAAVTAEVSRILGLAQLHQFNGAGTPSAFRIGGLTKADPSEVFASVARKWFGESQANIDALDAIIATPFSGQTVTELLVHFKDKKTAFSQRESQGKQAIAPKGQYDCVRKQINSMPELAASLAHHINKRSIEEMTLANLIIDIEAYALKDNVRMDMDLARADYAVSYAAQSSSDSTKSQDGPKRGTTRSTSPAAGSTREMRDKIWKLQDQIRALSSDSSMFCKQCSVCGHQEINCKQLASLMTTQQAAVDAKAKASGKKQGKG
jgi:hypothetical protein